MAKAVIFCIFLLFMAHSSRSSFVFHENTRILFHPEYDAEYFGYSTVLSPEGLSVGAPKSRAAEVESGTKPGVVFNCPLNDLDVKNVSCTPLKRSIRAGTDSNEDNMFFGASMALLPNGKLLINAPKWTRTLKIWSNNYLLMNGVCYLQSSKDYSIIYPLGDVRKTIYETKSSRREYGEIGTTFYYYQHGEAGFSVAVTKMNTVILGAPGLLHWTGGIVSMKFHHHGTRTNIMKVPVTNPYFTKDSAPDEYLGYSVESGVFQKDGKVLYVAGAPRSNVGSGKVLIFVPPTKEEQPLNVKAKVMGPQIGSYFGASLCCTDINGDGLDDLLVGAPTYVKKDGGLSYDQGAVFVYLTKDQGSKFILEDHGHVSGSGTNGARFGISIADLGDIDGDGFKDVAIGAPWEDERKGAVYIYKGSSKGLNTNNVQRIQPEGGKGFGWSIAKGVDVDHNNCSDLAVGALNTDGIGGQTSYLYRCIPTMKVHASITVPNAINLPQNTTSFLAKFCVSAPSIKSWPFVEINMIATIEVDPGFNRARLSGDSTYSVNMKPGKEILCNEQYIKMNPVADLSKPISLIFRLEPVELMKDNSTTFLMNAARLSEASTLKTSFLIQLVRDCSEDLVCTPWLVMILQALDNPYIPGSNTTLGTRLRILNMEEPAYAAKVNISLPMPPKRIPSACSLQDLNMICDLPSPLLRGEAVEWEIEPDYDLYHDVKDTEDKDLNLEVKLTNALYRNITDDDRKVLVVKVVHKTNFTVSGKAILNDTLLVSREDLAAGANVTFKHYFQITNLGPSDSSATVVYINKSERINFTSNKSECEQHDTHTLKCVWSVPAKVSRPVYVSLQMDLSKEGKYLKENSTYNATTFLTVINKHRRTKFQVMTTLNLEPERITWTLILICVLLGLFLLAVIVTILYKRGFFQRKTRQLLEEQKRSSQQQPAQMTDSSSRQNLNDEDHDIPQDDLNEETVT